MAPKKIHSSPTKTNNQQQDIASNHFLLLMENKNLARAISELYQRTQDLNNTMNLLKQENSISRQKLTLNPSLQQIQGTIKRLKIQQSKFKILEMLNQNNPNNLLIQWIQSNRLKEFLFTIGKNQKILQMLKIRIYLQKMYEKMFLLLKKLIYFKKILVFSEKVEMNKPIVMKWHDYVKLLSRRRFYKKKVYAWDQLLLDIVNAQKKNQINVQAKMRLEQDPVVKKGQICTNRYTQEELSSEEDQKDPLIELNTSIINFQTYQLQTQQ